MPEERLPGRVRGGQADLYLYDRDAAGGRAALRQLTNDEYNDSEPDLSPDGRQVVFASDRTAWGPDGAQNLFTLELATGRIRHLTAGPQVDLSPRWSPDGTRVAFASARREADGKFSAQDLWLADLAPSAPDSGAPDSVLAAAPGGADPEVRQPGVFEPTPADGAADDAAVELRQLTRFTSAAFDPAWVGEDDLAFAAFEDFRFTVRALDLDSLAAAPERVVAAGEAPLAEPWTYARYSVEEGEEGAPYARRYQLDVAQGGFASTTTASAQAGGATIAFSDMLGNDRIYVTAYSVNSLQGGRSFWDGLNVSATRVHLGRRANWGYGAFRLAGPRFDRTDPAQASRIPSYEQQVGGLGLVSYPLSYFRRIDLETSFAVGQKTGLLRGIGGSSLTAFDTLRTATLSNQLSLVEDHALYGMWGPVQGFRANLGVGYATDLWLSNESFYSVRADVRNYLRITDGVTFASWGLFQANVGRRARLNLLGGSWSLRGFPFLRVRGSKLWFTSHELRFPVLRKPPLYPVFAGLRGALFADAAHNWTDGYNDVFQDPDFGALGPGERLLVGTTKGSVGVGLRTSILGAIVLRYDIGYRFADGFDWEERAPFSQFFFGYDF